jgi:hypothetical protein
MREADALCPDCEEPLARSFESTSGLGAQKQGDAFNTAPDTQHFVCFPCGRAWKQRLSGPLTPDIVGELTFFTCRVTDCGRALEVISGGDQPAGTELSCDKGHRYRVVASGEGLTIEACGRG